MHLQGFLPLRIARLGGRLAASMSEIYGDRHGLSRDEWRVLSAAGEAAVQPTRTIAERTGLDKVAISRAASRLEERGLIRRGPDRADRRIKNLSLTRPGAAALEEIERLAREREAWLLAPLTPAEREVLEDLLARLAQQAEREAPTGAPEPHSAARPRHAGLAAARR